MKVKLSTDKKCLWCLSGLDCLGQWDSGLLGVRYKAEDFGHQACCQASAGWFNLLEDHTDEGYERLATQFSDFFVSRKEVSSNLESCSMQHLDNEAMQAIFPECEWDELEEEYLC